MAAVSKKQRRFFGMLEHNPGMAKSRGVHMSKAQMHDFAATPEKGLPSRSRMSQSKRRMRDRSTMGSPPMQMHEMMQGYRKMPCPPDRSRAGKE